MNMTFAQLIQNQEQQEQAHHTHNASTEKLFEMQANVLEKLSFQVGNWSDKLEAGLNDTNATLAMLMHKQEQQVQVDHTHNARTERLFNKMQANILANLSVQFANWNNVTRLHTDCKQCPVWGQNTFS
jgi:hypothetical protein